MSEWLTIERSINRDENDKIIPEVVEVEGITEEDGSHPKIKVDPIPRGKLKRLNKQSGGDLKRSQEEQLILDHVIEPAYAPEHFDKMSEAKVQSIVFALLSVSTNMPQEDIKNQTIASMIKITDEELKKKSS